MGVELAGRLKNLIMVETESTMPQVLLLHEVDYLLLYLTSETFCGDTGNLLADEIRSAQSAGQKILMLHENDPARHGCWILAQSSVHTILLRSEI